MKVGVISDTHDHLEPVEKAIKIFKTKEVQTIVHCGDWVAPYAVKYFFSLVVGWDIPIYSVFGNNEGDIRNLLKRNEEVNRRIIFANVDAFEFAVEDKKVAVYHGHDIILLNALIYCGFYNAVFTGHTHTVKNEVVNGVLILNPGTTSYFNGDQLVNEASVAIYDSQASTAEIIFF